MGQVFNKGWILSRDFLNYWGTTTCLSLEKAVVMASFQDFLQSTLFLFISDLYSLRIPIQTWKFPSLWHFIFLNLGPRLLFCFHTISAIFPTTTHHWVPVRVLTCPETLRPSSWPPLSPGSRTFPVTPLLRSAAILPRVSWCHMRHRWHECPNPMQCFPGGLLSLCCISSPCARGTRAQSRDRCQGHTATANQGPERIHEGLKQVYVQY